MNIKSVTFHHIKMPLKAAFTTHLGTVTEREAIVAAIEDQEGVIGYGECVAFSSPWYTEETIKTCYHVMVDFLLPLLKENSLSHPEQASMLFESIKRNYMAKACLETGLWDLYAKEKEISLAKLLGGKRDSIPSGVVVATKSTEEALVQIENYLTHGYKRIKIKISPENDTQILSEIRKQFPNIAIMSDANSAYSLSHLEQLRELDRYDLLMIEQPLQHDDIVDHAKLQKQLKTPICLDESIVTFDDARHAVELGSCKVINIKFSRVGGHANAKRIHDYCVENDISLWCGGMIEFGISRAHNIALASLPGFTIPGDISASSRYWEEDIIFPEVTVTNGEITVPNGHGIGFEINEKRLNEVTVAKEKFIFE